jgi:hypothetical protein
MEEQKCFLSIPSKEKRKPRREIVPKGLFLFHFLYQCFLFIKREEAKDGSDKKEDDANIEEKGRRFVVVARHIIDTHQEEIEDQASDAGVGEETAIGSFVLAQKGKNDLDEEVGRRDDPGVIHPGRSEAVGFGIVDETGHHDEEGDEAPDEHLDPLPFVALKKL